MVDFNKMMVRDQAWRIAKLVTKCDCLHAYDKLCWQHTNDRLMEDITQDTPACPCDCHTARLTEA